MDALKKEKEAAEKAAKVSKDKIAPLANFFKLKEKTENLPKVNNSILTLGNNDV
jgi:hypothetical protein